MNAPVDKTPEEVVIAQRDAQRLVSDATIRAAFETVKGNYLKGWTLTTPGETEKREQAYMLYKAISDVWAHLERQANSARVRDLRERGPNG